MARLGVFGICSLLVAAVFLAFAALQYNDPDPVRWILIYSAAAMASILAVLRPHTLALPLLVGAAAALGAAVVGRPLLSQPVAWAQVFGTVHMVDAHAEEMRETLGLLMVAAWMAVVAARGGRRRHPDPG